MFAVIKLSGKQFQVTPGIKVVSDRINGYDADASFDVKDVLLLSKEGGEVVVNPENASVKLKVLAHYRDHKVIIFKKKRRKGYRRKNGHRQEKTLLLVESIVS